MPRQTFETPMPACASDLCAWHLRPGAFERLSPPWQSVELVEPGPVENGSRVRISLRKGPLRLPWTAEHRDVDPGRGFTDFQVRGPFSRWVHRHEFEPDAGSNGSTLRDRIDWELPGGALGRALAGRQVRRDLSTTFAFRHETTKRDLERHSRFAAAPRPRVAVSGATGLVGANLVPFLTTGGHEVVRLVRQTGDPPPGAARWSPDEGLLSLEELGRCDAVVHLAGENVAGGRWTSARKERIRASRVNGTRNLVRTLGRLDQPPAAFVCASAIGYYGSRGDALLDEECGPGEGFLAEVAREWEAAADEAAALGMRVVKLRIGVILTPAGGALAKMLLPFRLGTGGRIGGGDQYLSWVSIDDVVGGIHRALLDPTLAGAVNLVAPEPVTNQAFTRTLGRVLQRPTPFPMPGFAARAAFGEMADEMLLASLRVEPAALERAGFRFYDTVLEETLARLLGKVEFS